ncbi:hypothetical protein GCM10007389_05670 [Pontibacter akesuensis]|nr:hypothetical protein GCM10007389_05670 [Pontibacter akesuensis]
MGQLKEWWKDRVSPARDAAPFSTNPCTTSSKINFTPATKPEKDFPQPTGYQAGTSTGNVFDDSFLSLLKKVGKETFYFVVPSKAPAQKAWVSDYTAPAQEKSAAAGSVAANGYANDLWLETEKLLKAGSWKYDVEAQSFICTPNTYTLLQIPAPSEALDFNALLPYFTEADQGKLADCWNCALHLRQESEYTSKLHRGPEEVWLKLKFKPLCAGDKLISVVGSIEDVSEKVAEEGKLILEKKKAEAVTQAKNALMSLYSHEIRTPLNSIMGLTYLALQDQHLAPDHRRYLNSIHFSAKHLLSLSENSLDHSKIEAGKLELEVEDFRIKDLLHNLHQSFYATALEKQVDFKLHLDKSVPEEVSGDPIRLTQILHNLIGNALKFTKEGYVRLLVDVVYQSDSDCVLEFAVEDTGIGIPEDCQQLIFESYKQARPSTYRQFGGTGLGLSITKEIIELHKGEIELTSAEGVGSVFKVRLKYGRAAAPAAPPVAEQYQSNCSLEGLRVLVIDDDAMNTLVTSELLRKWGALTDTAENGLLALEKLKQNSYDLVLMDLYMPDMNGFETITQVRNSGLQVPFVALTGTANKEEICRLLTLGVNDYLVKPFHPQQLYNKLVQVHALASQTPDQL